MVIYSQLTITRYSSCPVLEMVDINIVPHHPYGDKRVEADLESSVSIYPNTSFFYEEMGYAFKVLYKPEKSTEFYYAAFAPPAVVIMFLVISVLAIGLYFLWKYWRQHTALKHHEIATKEMREWLLEMNEHRSSDQDVNRWMIRMDEVTITERIAEGSYGVVFKGIYQVT
jgi:hypothetical protein